MPDKRNTLILPSAKYLRECFTYDPETGVIRWERRPQRHFVNLQTCKMWNTRYAGKIAGFIHKQGYREIPINHRHYKSHRVIWKLMTSKEPPITIDHRDGDRANNSWSNLRAATKQEQRWNSRPLKNRLHEGVCRAGSKWRARITINGDRLFRDFYSLEEAAAAYQEMAREAHGKFYHQG